MLGSSGDRCVLGSAGPVVGLTGTGDCEKEASGSPLSWSRCATSGDGTYFAGMGPASVPTATEGDRCVLGSAGPVVGPTGTGDCVNEASGSVSSWSRCATSRDGSNIAVLGPTPVPSLIEGDRCVLGSAGP
eukprot:9265170-Pyramimonas_sp.AAC.1